MNRLRFAFYLFLGSVVMAVSCKDDDSKEKNPPVIEIEVSPSKQDTIWADKAGVSYSMMDKAISFRSTLKNDKGYRSGIYIYDTKSINTYSDAPEKLVARLALLGFKDIYVSVSKNAILGTDIKKNQWLKNFNAYAHKQGLTLWALSLASNEAFVSDATITNECQRILNFNKMAELNERFDAVSADWEPHVLKKDGVDTPSGLDYFWNSDTNYGIGKSNDMLLKRTMDMLQKAKEDLNGLPLNEAIHYMYQNNYNDGQLSYGSTLQFLVRCNYVTVMCYANTKEKIWQRGLSPLVNAKSTGKSVSICIKTSLNTYGDGGDASTSLQPKGWDYLLECLTYFYAQGQTEPAFRGVDFFEYEGLEIMWNEK